MKTHVRISWNPLPLRNFTLSILVAALFWILLAGCKQSSPPPLMTTTSIAQTDTIPPASASTAIPTYTVTSTLSPTATPTAKPTSTPTKQPVSPFGSPFVAHVFWGEPSLQIGMAKLDEDPIQLWALTEEDNPAYQPVYSPDGAKLAYLLVDPTTEKSLFKLIDLSNGDISQLSSQPVDISGNYCWSFDQKYLVWGGPGSEGIEMDIYRLEIATGEIINLTQKSTVWDAFPNCSPVNDQVAFVSDRKGAGKELDNIWVMDYQGENLKQLTNTPSWENKFPGWTPDGSEITFYRFQLLPGFPIPEEDEKHGPDGLWSVSPDGSDERLIAEFESQNAIGASVWSPDGQFVAYVTGQDETMIVHIIPASGGEPIWSSDLPGNNRYLSWSASSEYLIFTNAQDTGSRIYMINIHDLDLKPMLPYPDNLMGMFAPAGR